MTTLDNKEKFTQALNSVLYEFDQLETSYREVKFENDILWQVMLDFGDKPIWNSLFTVMVNSTNNSMEFIVDKIRELLDRKKYSLVLEGLNHLLRVPFPDIPSETLERSVSLILDTMFSMNISDLDEMDRLSIEMLKWMRKTSSLALENTVNEFLYDKKVKMNQLIADTNSPDIILAYLSTLLTFDLYSPLRDMMEYLLDNEWPFLDSKIKEEHFAIFLWISSYLSMDTVLLERSNDSRRFIEQANIPEIHLFNIFNGVKESLEDGNQMTSENMVTLMNQSSLFGKSEKEKLWEEVIRYIERQKKSTDTPELSQHLKKASSIWQIKNGTDHCPHCIQFKLTKENYLVDGYPKKSEQSQKQVVFELLSCGQCHRTYSYDNMNKKLNQALEPYRCIVKLDPIDYPPKKVDGKSLTTLKNTEALTTTKTPKVDGFFAWPSTEANESKGLAHREGNFREETDLHRLGYKITGLNRIQRWDILVRKAIPNLTLKEIVYTIAQNVRLRKSQAGGKTKFAYAIAEWEYDLNRLKQEYYKSNFVWPQY